MSGSAAEEAQFVVEMVLSFLRRQLTIFPEFREKVRSGLLQVGRGALALGRAGIVVLLFGLGFARLVIRFGGIRFVVCLVNGRTGNAGFAGEFSFTFPVLSINSLDEFLESCEGVWLIMVDHIVFDTFGQSVVSLSAECCFPPLDT